MNKMDRDTQSGVISGSEDPSAPADGDPSPVRDCSATAETCQTSRNIGIPPPLYDSEADKAPDLTKPEPCACVRTPVPSYRDIYTPEPESTTSKKSSLLPSYSTVMQHQPHGERCVDLFHPPAAPPTYNDVPGVYVIPSSRQFERVYAIPSLPETLWRPHSQPAYCPRCEVLILTLIQTHETLATHVAALALCLFGCWPCCLLPYCLNICKNTYHLCPICKRYLGAYTPW